MCVYEHTLVANLIRMAVKVIQSKPELTYVKKRPRLIKGAARTTEVNLRPPTKDTKKNDSFGDKLRTTLKHTASGGISNNCHSLTFMWIFKVNLSDFHQYTFVPLTKKIIQSVYLL